MMPEIRSILEKCKEKASEKRDANGLILKEAFSVFFGAQNMQKKKRSMMFVQNKWQLRFYKKQKVWADNFRKKFEDAIIAYKSEKRKFLEARAAKCMKDTLAKHLFRNRLSHGIAARNLVIRGVYNRAYVNKLTKYLLSNMLAKRIVTNAFSRARETIRGKAAWNVQRALRGYMARNQGDRLQWVKDAIAAKQKLRLNVSAKKIQKRLKGLLVRRRIEVINRTASQIQAILRMRWHRQVFLMIKKNTLILQRAVRRYMARRDMIKERMKAYLTHEFQVMDNVREMENFQLFGEEGTDQGLIKNHTPYSIKKIFLFNRVCDMHVITDLSEMHSTPWAAQWMKVYKDNIAAETPIMSLEIGQSHSFACTGRGKAYVWGWNDNGQCAKDPMYTDEVIIKQNSKVAQLALFDKDNGMANSDGSAIKCSQIICCEDRCLVISQDAREVYAWGGNERGQLGLGHYSTVCQPTCIDYFVKHGLKVNSLDAGGYLTLACDHKGQAFAWPFTKNGQKYSIPVQMPFSEKINITRVSCGYNFGFFISQQGLVYAVGKDNQDGQLGLGHIYPNDIPELITCFKDAGERIDSVECGFRHAIARSTLGKVYTWGWNAHGQLGHGHFDSEISPRPLVLEKGKLNKDKAIQIAAGYSHTVIMTEARELLWFGTSGTLSKQSTPV